MSPSHKNVPHGSCVAVREVLNRVGDKWSVLIVQLLADEPKRFSELRHTIEGISQRMLTLTLKGLERDGLVTRTVYPSLPLRVEYELTELGCTLRKPIQALAKWAQENRERIQQSRNRYDAQSPAAAQQRVRS
jgi:DNA-binding HxlR family transcriptional regulator